MNFTGDYATSIDDIKNGLIQQVTNSVRWEQSIRAMDRHDIDCYIEIGCGKTLSGMNKHIKVRGNTFNVDKISDMKTLENGIANCPNY